MGTVSVTTTVSGTVTIVAAGSMAARLAAGMRMVLADDERRSFLNHSAGLSAS
jgi:hypothetical protein